MKIVRIVITSVMTVLIVIAWIAQINNAAKKKTQLKQLLEEAEAQIAEKLYQKAIATYDEAIKIEDSDEVREKWIGAYELAYEDLVVSEQDYAKALLNRCEKHPKDAINWEKIIELYYSNGSYKKAYEAVKKAEKAGAESEVLQELEDTVCYSYTEKSKVYLEYYRSPEGYYTVYDGRNWGVMKPDGEMLHERVFLYASPIGTSHETVLMSSRDMRVVDDEAIVHSIISVDYDKMRPVNDDIIPVQSGGSWKFYRYSEGKTVLSGYEDASAFEDGTAAVKENGKWKLIDEKGTAISEADFDEIKLHQNGEYAYKDVMIAVSNGRFGIYDARGNMTGNISCKDADVYLGEAIAYQDSSERWGYVNLKGETVLSPQYEAAKSFSNGLAAVCKDGKWGFINNSGKLVIPYQFLDADYFSSGGIAMVSDLEEEYHIVKLRFPQ